MTRPDIFTIQFLFYISIQKNKNRYPSVPHIGMRITESQKIITNDEVKD